MRISVEFRAAGLKKKVRVPIDWNSLIATVKEKFGINRSTTILLYDAHGLSALP